MAGFQRFLSKKNNNNSGQLLLIWQISKQNFW